MKKGQTSVASFRLQELQEKFRDLEPGIEDSEIKKALSIINGMVMELSHQIGSSDDNQSGRVTLKEIAGMFRNAPRMEGEALNEPLPEGIEAPDFSLKDANGNVIRLSDYRGSTVMLVFYPLDWSPGCSQQLDLYQHESEEFKKRGVSLLGISVDSIYSHGAWSVVRNIRFPLLSDFNPKGDIAKKYHVYRDSDGFSERALYLVDGDGTIRYAYVSPQIHHVPDIYALFRKLDEILKPVTA